MTESLLSIEDARLLYEAGDAAHDFDHVLRVARLAEKIALAEGADVAVVRLAALLHDLPVPGEPHEPTAQRRNAHHLRAAARAQRLLLERGASPTLAEQIAHCIEAHRHRDASVRPQTLEAQCLYDADKLDAIGAIGVARAFAYAGAHGGRLWRKPARAIEPTENDPSTPDYTPVHEYVFKLRQLLDSLHTPTARAIGCRRHATMVAFFDALDAEMAESLDQTF
ncbi:HD domain-containing protein [Caldilinea sp.]|uniref:HD domain-containing protein n=1 Tax=Caldilinea sp. TaxID=2293560 RepID=UPI00260DD318|nr:HD domain-containing protein [uncultured Caldilinea sp.]